MNNKPLNGDERLDDVFSLEKNKLILLASEDYIIFLLITYWRVWLFRNSRKTMSNKLKNLSFKKITPFGVIFSFFFF